MERTEKGESSPCDIGKITFVDLAGSEVLARIGLDRMLYNEGMAINQSLHCLGRAIKQSAYKAPINFDLHPLTKLMQDSLGGNSKTLMIACIGPSVYNIPETTATLNYAV